MVSCVGVFLLAGMTGSPPAIPGELLEAFAGRAKPQSMKCEYLFREKLGQSPAREQVIEMTNVGDDLVFVDNGDRDGILFRDPQSGEPMFGTRGACLPMYELIRTGTQESWRRYETNAWAGHRLGGGESLFTDPRLLGIGPWPERQWTLFDHVQHLQSLPMERWEVKQTSDVVVVVGWLESTDNKRFAYEWRLDPARDLAILEVATLSENGRSVMARHEEYREIDGYWWPMKVWRSMGPGSFRSIEYNRVEFDRKDHPRRLTPEHIGLPVGGYVRKMGEKPRQVYRYIGDNKYVTAAEFEEMKAGLEMRPFNNLKAKIAALGPGYYPAWWDNHDGTYGIRHVERKPDEWEIYVRRWKIQHGPKSEHPLSEAQAKSADTVLKSCRQRADNILKKYAGSTDQESAEKQVVQVFEDLKSRLSRLLTSPQSKQEGANAETRGARPTAGP